MTVRATILAALRESHEGLDTNALARAVGLHPNTVRWHLGILGDQGLVRSTPERRQRRGRPSVIYRVTADGVVHGRDEYHLLATMLAAVVAESPDDLKETAYETGVRWGRYLSEKPHPSQPSDNDAAVERVVALLNEQGFDSETEGETICMHRCPFHDLAETHPEIICTLHHGIIDGALTEAGSTLRVAKLHPFVRPTL